MRFYLQHGAGLGPLVDAALEFDLARPTTVFGDDSAVVIETAVKPARVARLPYVKNAFQVAGSVPRGPIPRSVEQLTKQIQTRSLLADQPKRSPFRIMVNIDGQLTGLPRDVRTRLETTIARATGGVLNPRGGAGVEYWIVGRRDLDALLLCVRLTSGGKQPRARGSLSSDLATLVVKASKPSKADVFLDPFAGSGSLVDARAAEPHQATIYSDIRLSEFRDQFPTLRGPGSKILDEDALLLPSLATGSVSAIATDPPWGEYEELTIPYPEFIGHMLASFDRVLDRDRGRLVLLLARRDADLVASLWQSHHLHVAHGYEILVNGHPATVLVGGRASSKP